MLLNCNAGEDSWESLGHPWRSNQSILKEISPEYSLEGLMLKLKLQHFGHLMWRSDSLEKTLIWKRLRQEKKGTIVDEMVGWYHWLDGHEFEQAVGVGDGLGSMAYCSPWGRKELDTTEQLSMVSVCLPSDALLKHLPSYLGFSYLGHGVSLHGCSSKAQLLLLPSMRGISSPPSLPASHSFMLLINSWGIWFCPLLQNFYIIQLLLCLLGAVLSGSLEMLLPGLEV